MPKHQSAGGSAESAIGDQCHRFAQPLTNNRGGYAEHFPHAGAAFRTLVANYHHVASFNLFLRNRCHGLFFRLEDAGGSAMREPLVTADFGYTPFRSKIPLK